MQIPTFTADAVLRGCRRRLGGQDRRTTGQPERVADSAPLLALPARRRRFTDMLHLDPPMPRSPRRPCRLRPSRSPLLDGSVPAARPV